MIRGGPGNGEARRLTAAEARLLGFSQRWTLRRGNDGVLAVLRPWRGMLWVVDMDDGTRAAMAAKLQAFWGVGVLSVDELRRVVSAARGALGAGMNRRVTAEMEWVARLDSRL